MSIYLTDEIIATNVSFEDYVELYSGEYCEWVEGVVIKLAPAGLRHNALIGYLFIVLRTYFEFRPLGKVLLSPFIVRLPDKKRGREPDLLVILNDNPHTVTDTMIDGPADICIEIISPESIDRDRGTKFTEYERGGVKEYWLLDHIREEALFYRLNENGKYIQQPIDAEKNYFTPLLPGLALHVPTLWQEELPTTSAIVAAVRRLMGLA